MPFKDPERRKEYMKAYLKKYMKTYMPKWNKKNRDKRNRITKKHRIKKAKEKLCQQDSTQS